MEGWYWKGAWGAAGLGCCSVVAREELRVASWRGTAGVGVLAAPGMTARLPARAWLATAVGGAEGAGNLGWAAGVATLEAVALLIEVGDAAGPGTKQGADGESLKGASWSFCEAWEGRGRIRGCNALKRAKLGWGDSPRSGAWRADLLCFTAPAPPNSSIAAEYQAQRHDASIRALLRTGVLLIGGHHRDKAAVTATQCGMQALTMGRAASESDWTMHISRWIDIGLP